MSTVRLEPARPKDSRERIRRAIDARALAAIVRVVDDVFCDR